MEYNEWKLKLIEIISDDKTVSDNTKVQEIKTVFVGSYDDTYGEGILPEDAWQDEKDCFDPD
jgi:hypothetical protein